MDDKGIAGQIYFIIAAVLCVVAAVLRVQYMSGTNEVANAEGTEQGGGFINSMFNDSSAGSSLGDLESFVGEFRTSLPDALAIGSSFDFNFLVEQNGVGFLKATKAPNAQYYISISDPERVLIPASAHMIDSSGGTTIHETGTGSAKIAVYPGKFRINVHDIQTDEVVYTQIVEVYDTPLYSYQVHIWDETTAHSEAKRIAEKGDARNDLYAPKLPIVTEIE